MEKIVKSQLPLEYFYFTLLTMFLKCFIKLPESSTLFKLIWEERILAQLPLLFLLKFFLNEIIRDQSWQEQSVFYLLYHSGALHNKGWSKSVIMDGSNKLLQCEQVKHFLWNALWRHITWFWSAKIGFEHLQQFSIETGTIMNHFHKLIYDQPLYLTYTP